MRTIYAHKTTVAGDAGNLGDMMGFHIADWLIGSDAYRRAGIRQKDALPPGTVALVGSLIAALVNSRARVVGGGLINASPRVYGSEVRIEAVRGFLTQAIVERDAQQTPEVIGDPGLMLSRISPMLTAAEKHPIGFIIHDVDREEFALRYPEHVDDIIDNYAPREEFVSQLSQYSAVASTSLHGCIFSNSYGIPVAPFVLTDKVFGGDFKFRDHFSALGFDIRRIPLEGATADILASIHEFPQPTREQVDALIDKQIDRISAALRD